MTVPPSLWFMCWKTKSIRWLIMRECQEKKNNHRSIVHCQETKQIMCLICVCVFEDTTNTYWLYVSGISCISLMTVKHKFIALYCVVIILKKKRKWRNLNEQLGMGVISEISYLMSSVSLHLMFKAKMWRLKHNVKQWI